MSIVSELVKIAKAKGASSSASAQTVTEAVDLLLDTLTGSDNSQKHTIEQAITAIADYINVEPSGSKSITSNGSSVDVKAYAKANVNVPAYVVSFSANGGTGTVAPMACANGSSITLPDSTGLTAPSNKTFAGWGTASDTPAASVITKYSATAAATLYAIWQSSE